MSLPGTKIFDGEATDATARATSCERAAAPASRGRAVVIGGGIAGMLAARVLADHFQQVTLIERDRCPEEAANRPGVPQARHVHFLLKRGLTIMEELFPGLTADLLAAGCPRIDQGRDYRILYRTGWSPVHPCGLDILNFTRPVLEAAIRRRLVASARVSRREGIEVMALSLDASGQRVDGVRIRQRGARAGEERSETLAADLVVDASGRGSRAPEWFLAAGFPAPAETSVDAFWGYATRLYEPAPDFAAGWRMLLVMNRPPDEPRAGIIQWVEGDRWMVTVAGVMEDYPPTDERGFLEFARSLRSPALYEAIQHARPVSDIWGYRRTDNRLRHFERLTRSPERFIALGDAVCCFNPVYAQGMTLASLGAAELGRALRHHGTRGLDGLARRFQRRLARVISGPWALATGEDLRWPATRGGKITPKVRFLHWYIDQVIQRIPGSAEIYRRFQEVNHMLKPAGALFHPAILLPILRQAFTSALSRRGTGAAAEQAEPAIG
jgi:2-polyprenyl-6-methoxyphenol hydroxylase-like FAD-dependent oxidoreductase